MAGAGVAGFNGLARTFLRDRREAFIAEELDRAGKQQRPANRSSNKKKISFKKATNLDTTRQVSGNEPWVLDLLCDDASRRLTEASSLDR
jgi:hypothetical protein